MKKLQKEMVAKKIFNDVNYFLFQDPNILATLQNMQHAAFLYTIYLFSWLLDDMYICWANVTLNFR